MAYPAAQAVVAITTNPVYKKLVTAIEQAQHIKTCEKGWNIIAQSSLIAAADHAQILDQALQLAQIQKTVLAEELTHLGAETKNRSKIKWGVGQLALGMYLMAGEIDLIRRKGDISPVLWPESLTYATPFMKLGGIFVITRLCALNLVVPPYLFFKAYKNLKHGLNYQQYLQDKIANLDATIAYLQSLQTNN